MGGGAEPPAGGGARSLAVSIVTLVLIVGASVAFLRAQTLKLEPSPFERPRVERVFSPTCGCDTKATATLAFTVKVPVRVNATIVDAGGRPVRPLARGERWRPGRRTLQWDGRDGAGRLVPDGDYRLRLGVVGRDEPIEVPTPVRVDTAPPRATRLTVTPANVRAGELSGRRPWRILVRFRGSEEARPLLLVDGRSATRLSVRRPGPVAIRWNGHVRGRPLARGRHAVAVRLRDGAGNLGAPSRPVRLRVDGGERPRR